jgi:uncharacterized protein YbaR (Trm112 family)
VKVPIYEYVTCPDCKREAYISMINSGSYWLADTLWSCPYCKNYSTTVELQEASENREDK